MSQITSPEDVEELRIIDIMAMSTPPRPDPAQRNTQSDSTIAKTLSPDVRVLRLAVAKGAQERKAQRLEAKRIKAEEAKRKKDASKKAARRAPTPIPKHSSSNNRGALFPLNRISMTDRRFLIDAVDTLKSNGEKMMVRK